MRSIGICDGMIPFPPEILLGYAYALLRSSTSLCSAQDDTGGLSFVLFRELSL